MSDSKSSAGGGIGLGGAVFLVFLVLKLTGHIDWSWWWVTAPLWGVVAFALAMMLVGLLLTGIAAVIAVIPDGRARRRR